MEPWCSPVRDDTNWPHGQHMLTGESNLTLARLMFSVVMIALRRHRPLHVIAALRSRNISVNGRFDSSQLAAPNLLGALPTST